MNCLVLQTNPLPVGAENATKTKRASECGNTQLALVETQATTQGSRPLNLHNHNMHSVQALGESK